MSDVDLVRRVPDSETTHTVHTHRSDDGLVQGAVYFDFLGRAHYVVARRKIELYGFAGDDMVAVKRWEFVTSGTGDTAQSGDALVDLVKHVIVDAHKSTAEQWQRMLARVEAHQVPWR